MSDYHILSGNRDGNTFTVVSHWPVPNVNNDVGVNYRTALVEAGMNPAVSRVPFITGAEQVQLDGGELFEFSSQFNTHPGESLAAKQARLDALYTSMQSEATAGISNILSYWGFSRDVP